MKEYEHLAVLAAWNRLRDLRLGYARHYRSHHARRGDGPYQHGYAVACMSIASDLMKVDKMLAAILEKSLEENRL